MDIIKLEALSALKLDPEIKDSVEKSLLGIVDMLHAIDSIEIKEIPTIDFQESKLADDLVDNNYLQQKDNSNLNLHEGLFLAPKVIIK